MCASKENILLHCYLAGIIQALLSACRGAVTAEITCFHKALSALRRGSLPLNPVHCLLVYSFFNYRQSQVSSVTDTVSLCKSMRQCCKGRRVFPENLCCSELWVNAVLMELTRAKLLSSLGLSPPSQPVSQWDPSGVVQAPTSLGNSLPCVGISASKAVIKRAAGLSPGAEGTEKMT